MLDSGMKSLVAVHHSVQKSELATENRSLHDTRHFIRSMLQVLL